MIRQKPPERILEEISLASERIGTELLPQSRSSEKETLAVDSSTSTSLALRRELFVEGLKAVRCGEEFDASPAQQKRIRYIEALSRLDRYVEAQQLAKDPVLREHQIDTFEDLRNALEEGIKTGYIKLPTGAGKTVIFTELIEALGLKSLIVVPTEELIDQTVKQLKRHAPDVKVSQIYGGRKEKPGECNITSYAYLIRAMQKKHWKSDDFDLVILDEAHLALGSEGQNAVDQLAEHALVIGFSATPEYNPEKSLDLLLGTCIHRLSALEAIRRGILCPVSNLVMRVNLDLSKVKVGASGEYDDAELEAALTDAASIKTAVDLCRELFKDKKIIIRCAGVKHAESVAQALKNVGLQAESISGDDPKRAEKLKAYRANQLRILCNDKLLTAGFDDEETSVVLNLVPNFSKVVEEQLGGRALRLNSNDLTKHAVVADVMYKDPRPGKKPITYSDVLEGRAVVTASDESEKIDQPQWLVERCAALAIEGIEIAMDIDTIRSYQPTAVVETIELAPEGWLTKAMLARSIRSSSVKIEVALEQVKDAYTDDIKLLRTSSGRTAQFFSPELCKRIQEIISSEYALPAGWVGVKKLERELQISRETVDRYFERFRLSRPDYFADYKVRGYQHGLVRHYHPELIQLMHEELGEPKPPGWEALSAIIPSGGWQGKLACKIASQFVSELSAVDAGEYRISETKREMTLSPSAANVLREKIVYAICSELGIARIASELDCSEEEVRATLTDAPKHVDASKDHLEIRDLGPNAKYSQAMKGSKPIRVYEGTEGPPFEYCAEGNLSNLIDQLAARKKAPEGWRTRSAIAAELVKAELLSYNGRVQDAFFERIMVEFPRLHMRGYRNRETGMVAEHFSPELQQRIFDVARKKS